MSKLGYQPVPDQNSNTDRLPLSNSPGNNTNTSQINLRNNPLYVAIIDVLELLNGGYKNLSSGELATVIFNVISAILWIINSTNIKNSDFNQVLSSNYLKIAIAILAVINVSLIISYILNVFRDKKVRIYISNQQKTLIYWTITTNNRTYYIGVKESNDSIIYNKSDNKYEKINNYKLIISSQKPIVNSPEATNFIWIVVKNGDKHRNIYKMDKEEAFSLYSISASGYVCANRDTHKVDLAVNLNEWERFNVLPSENISYFAIENTSFLYKMYLSFNDSTNEESRELNITEGKNFIFNFIPIFEI